MSVFETCVDAMNHKIQEQMRSGQNPFMFQHVEYLKRANVDDSEPCVFFACPGMMQRGASRDLFERWCSSRQNACIMTGLAVANSFAAQVINRPVEVGSLFHLMKDLNFLSDSHWACLAILG